MSESDQPPTLREVPTIAGTFLAYGALFFDRLAPLYLVALIVNDLPVSPEGQGTLALTIGIGWAGSMALARWTSGRWGNRRRILVAAAGVAMLGAASALVTGWATFVILRGLGGLLAGTAAPAVTALSFAAAPAHRRGLDLGVVQSSTRLLGSLVSPVVVTAVAATLDWRAALLTSSGFVVVGALALVVLVPRVPPPAGDTAASAAPVLHPGGRRNIWLCTASSVALVMWLIIVSQGGGPLLQAWLDLSVAEAGRLLSLFGVGAWLATLVVPLASDRIGRRGALAAASLVGSVAGLGVAIAASESAGGWLTAAVLMTLSGVAMGGLPLVISIIPAEAIAAGDVGRALTAPIIGAELLGGAVLPAVAFAAAARVGLSLILGIVASLLLLVAALSLALHTPAPTVYDNGA
ncbi:MAG TPA: MFS transporter [Chloroflexota bacterium]|nr:MFS transporter [Chloroflexota bacterium]